MFNRLKAEDYGALKGFFEGHRYPLCEYSLASIIAWNRCLYEVSWKIDGGLLLMAETDLEPPASKRLLMPLPRPWREISPGELAEIARRNRHGHYYYVPESYLAPRRTEIEALFTVTGQPGYMDYLYNQRDMAELAGHKYSKKRNLIAQFNKRTAAARPVKVESITAKNSGLCLNLLDRWTSDIETGKHLDMLNCERKAIINSLSRFEPLEMEGVLVFIDGVISGFAFGSRLSNDTFVLNFEKALDNVKGLYQFLDNELAKRLPPHYSIINKESDLEKPGLAKAKESYYPAGKVKSYTLTLKQMP
ncbi:MAG: hypothetical protein A2021_02060 [Elusimicrobia bacterium GWF2_52_66]|nr:MAG: hypothetical protein A2X33_07860 [Elusimicrobia bacterium GWA2_51_34]OGR84910.1 MAG: hypothetical protein A2021_02060 [Elusimicrobia bacterium GWF2_52_66]HAF95592.1 hypothetical protein [Elusimicrobiota bacterium]HCE98837.1 hypothetical protein [Elusimicrobiota bacterium]